MADVALVRKRVRAAIDAARRDHDQRRTRVADATRLYDAFLEASAAPAFRTVASALKGEGLGFEVMTPAGGVRLVSERHRDDAIAIELDTSTDPPRPMVTITRARGGRSLRSERAVKADTSLAELTEDDVIDMLVEELRPWLA